MELTCSLSMPLCLHLHILTNPEALQTLTFWGFMEASLHSHNCLNHWSLTIESTSSPSPHLPKVSRDRGGGNSENSKPEITCLVLLATNPHLIITTIKIHLCAHCLENSQGFRSFVPEMGKKQYYKSPYYNS